jgi:hypothetical protein
MTNEAIARLVEMKLDTEKALNIHFKQRTTITGLFIRGNDYEDLRSKNFWRIVTNSNIEQWKKTKDINLARIFHGTEFTKLSEVN